MLLPVPLPWIAQWDRIQENVFKKDGSREVVLAGTLVRKAIPEILKQAKAKQIPVKEW